MSNTHLSTGLSSLDSVFQGLIAGDNLVWDIDSIESYVFFAQKYAEAAASTGKQLIYFRFAEHQAIVEASETVIIKELNPHQGFELFVGQLVDIVEKEADTAWFLFDCLSPLSKIWYADRMMANFFLIVCPFVLKMGSLAYFAVYKHNHSSHATDTIYDTAQIITEVWNEEDCIFIQPQKVENRKSPTMYMLHELQGESFIPVTSSVQTTDVIARETRPLLNFTIQRTGPWTASYHEAKQIEAALRRGEDVQYKAEQMKELLIRMVITRQERFMPLARKYLDLSKLLGILRRMIGSGLIGGKTRGILLARNILKEADSEWTRRLETHDSFFIGSDVFYTYIIQNDVWWLRRKKGNMEEILTRAAEAREKIMHGVFLDYIMVQFREMLEYFGQAPIIVRSSSIQEDSYGNAFSGKYESVFCANQGSPEERLEVFLNAVRTVYASSLNEDALRYRLHHGLLFEDEQMALLVQRVSGDIHGNYFFPDAGGVAFSWNPFVWHPDIKPEAGVLRLAFGLGTRAVDRLDDDYTRIASLNEPLRRPDKKAEDVYKYLQRKIDLIDLQENHFCTKATKEALTLLPSATQNLLFSMDTEAADRAEALGLSRDAALRLDFSGLFSRTDFIPAMRKLLETLQSSYEHPVDIEFTVNISEDGSWRVNLVQCRPFTVKIMGTGELLRVPENIQANELFLKSDGPIVGRSMASAIDRLIYVRPEVYTKLGEQDRHALARYIGKLVHKPLEKEDAQIMLIGPGRWGTSTTALGIPVQFNDIKGVSVLVELAIMHAGLVPDVSLGTHFFNDIVEMDMLYFAVFPDRSGCLLNEDFLTQHQDLLVHLEDERLAEAIIMMEGSENSEIRLYADATGQAALCYSSKKE